MPSTSKKHLHFSAWHDEDRALWHAAFKEGDVFDDDSRGAQLAPATKIGLQTAYARFLGFLAAHDPERLQLRARTRLDRDAIRTYVGHLRQSCRETSIASTLHMLRQALRLMFPETDWSWLNTIAKRVEAKATFTPSHKRRPFRAWSEAHDGREGGHALRQ